MKKSRPEALYSERQVGSGTSALKSENQALHVLIIQPRRKCGKLTCKNTDRRPTSTVFSTERMTEHEYSS
jgi:hypothetical protein